MAESPTGDALPVILIWLDSDWPDSPPLAELPAGSPVRFESQAYGLPGLRPEQPQLSMASVAVPTRCSLAQFIAHWLTPAARARLEQGGIGIAVFGRRGRNEQLLRAGDRIELLGPITADPKSNRLKRVRADRHERGRDKWRTSRAG